MSLSKNHNNFKMQYAIDLMWMSNMYACAYHIKYESNVLCKIKALLL